MCTVYSRHHSILQEVTCTRKLHQHHLTYTHIWNTSSSSSSNKLANRENEWKKEREKIMWFQLNVFACLQIKVYFNWCLLISLMWIRFSALIQFHFPFLARSFYLLFRLYFFFAILFVLFSLHEMKCVEYEQNWNSKQRTREKEWNNSTEEYKKNELRRDWNDVNKKEK